jgi:predicted XRE-type DNA-binding protein
MALNPKQQRFCDEYLIDLNATQAAIRAGYSKKTASAIGSENLTKKEIIEYINVRKPEYLKVVRDKADQAKRTKKGFVYVIQCEGTHYYKIGSSFNPNERLKNMQTGIPFDLKLIFSVEKEFANAVELMAHLEFGDHRVRAEWFTFSQPAIDKVINYLNKAKAEKHNCLMRKVS